MQDLKRYLVIVLAITAPALPAVSAPPDAADVAFISYLGGRGEDTIRDVAVGSDGDIYLTGGTGSQDFPVTPGAYDTTLNPGSGGASFGAHDAWVARLRPDGARVWVTFVGGPSYDRAYAIEVDASGVYIAGRAGASFPTTPGALQPSFAGDFNPGPAYGPQDGFVAKLSLDGTQLLWATYFGEARGAFIRDIAIDSTGHVYLGLTGVQAATPHVRTNAIFPDLPPGNQSGIVAKIAPDGRSVVWATYIGGSGDDFINPSVRVNDKDECFVVAHSTGTDLPVTAGAHQATFGGGAADMNVAGIAADGSSLLFLTYLGGSGSEGTETHGLEIGPHGDLYVAAVTDSYDFYTTPQAYAPGKLYAGLNGFITRMTTGGVVNASTYLGGTQTAGIQGIGASPAGDVLVTGASSGGYPMVGSPYQSTHAGGVDFLIARLSPNLDALESSTYIGGSRGDYGRSASVGPDGTLVVGGQGESLDFPTTDGSRHAPVSAGVGALDAAVVVFVPRPPAPPILLP